MNASHVATGTITVLIAQTLVYLTHFPLQPLDMTTALAFAGLAVAGAGAAVKMWQTYRPVRAPVQIRQIITS